MTQASLFDTEREHAKAPHRMTQRDRVLIALSANRAKGMTDCELEAALSIPRHIAAKRRGELVTAGKVRDSGLRRATDTGTSAVVWEVVN